jgi:hypothetical protein
MPDALYRISGAEVQSFLRACLTPVDIRPTYVFFSLLLSLSPLLLMFYYCSAAQLLSHPFFSESPDDDDIIVVTPKGAKVNLIFFLSHTYILNNN